MRFHAMLRVESLDASTAFYSALFDHPPTTRKPGYAKWSLDEPSVNFSIAERPAPHGVEHLGIEAATPDELGVLRERIGRATAALPAAAVYDEGKTTCCYANSDKTWVTDQHGVSWEAFHTTSDSATYHAEPVRAAGCCVPDCC